VCLLVHIVNVERFVIGPKLVDLIWRDIVGSHSNTWGNNECTTSEPMRMLHGDCILMTPTSICV